MGNKNYKLGCDLCQQICDNNIDISISEFYDKIYVYLKMCRNCEKPSCLEACSGDGIHWNEDSKQVVFDKENCVKCNMCVMVCPFDAIRSNENCNFTCSSCDKYEILIEKIRCLNEEKNNPFMNELVRENFANQLINKGF